MEQQPQQQQPGYQQPPPMQQQTVIIQQPAAGGGGIPQNQRDWSSGLFGCCEDVGSCIMGWFCLPCLACKVAGRLNESCCVPLFLQGGFLSMRVKLRTQYGISGSICGDWFTTCCCGALALCQMDRELSKCGI